MNGVWLKEQTVSLTLINHINLTDLPSNNQQDRFSALINRFINYKCLVTRVINPETKPLCVFTVVSGFRRQLMFKNSRS